MIKVLSENQWGKVSLAPLSSDLAQIIIDHQQCHGRISLYGGQVLSWQPSGEQEVFWLSKDSTYQQGKAIRGGIPLCWPWFGSYKKGGNHGFARQVNWQYSNIEILAEQVNITLVWQGEQQHELWPYSAKVTQTLCFGRQFQQSLAIENLSTETIEYTEALHSYFAVSDPKNVAVPALNNTPFDCKVSGLRDQRDNLINIVGPIDRVYTNSNTMEIIDKGTNRKITLTPTNVNNWVLWNPGKDIAENMTDVHQGGENEFICLEAANTNWQQLAPNNTVTIGQVISISAL